MFIERYDLDKDEKLCYTDIGSIFLSSQKKYRNLVLERSDFYKLIEDKEQIFSLET